MKKFLILFCLPLAVHANDTCVLQDKSVIRNSISISERSNIRKDVVPMPNGHRKCIVDFKVRVNLEWHTAFGEYTWSGTRPENEACAIAVTRGEDDVKQRIGRNQSMSERILICKDQPKLNILSSTAVGTVGEVGQFRPHPEHTGRFYHQGTQCKWFVDSAFTGRDVRTFQGIICQVKSDQWVVVDKF